MSKEIELLEKIISREDTNDFYISCTVRNEIKELLAQPEQETNQDIANDIEYLITAFENGADADEYWRPISDLRSTLKKVTLVVHQPSSLAFKIANAINNEIKELLAQPEQELIDLDQVDKHLEICDKSEEYKDGYSDGIVFAERHHNMRGQHE